jgi:energy-coupling factor transporter ATP-binding protein EcfA2
MKLQFVKPHSSITASVTDEDLANFIVLSGPNGSGKSHLLEAIDNGSVTVDGVSPGQGNVVRRFVSNQLVAQNDGAQTSGAFRDSWVNFETQATQVQRNLLAQNPGLADQPDNLEAQLGAQLIAQRQLTPAGLARITADAGKPLREFTHHEFRRHSPLLSGIKDPFQFSIGELFLSYHNRRERNTYLQWLRQEGKAKDEPLTDVEFEQRFGAPPWVTLNETLHLIGMDYSFVPPEGMEENQQYEVKLRHDTTEAEVTTNLLSSGEKTLLAIAMTLYTGSRLGEAIELPQILLLDEADASLHPSMVKSLLQVVREVFVATYGVKVIMTTHSPTTVALAPEEALYTMRRNPSPRLRLAANRDDALNSLTVGLSTLSVRVDNRRTVFVESEYDEGCYQELFRLLRPRLQTELSLEFVASGRGGQGNCDAVKYLVGKLRGGGNTTVWGIVDRDARAGAGGGVVFNPERYAIENLALDPLILGAFLVREGKSDSEALGLEPNLRHFDLRGEHAQRIVDAVSQAVKTADSETELVAVDYLGAFSVSVPKFWLAMRGHDLEARVCQVYPPLRAFARTLCATIISKGFGDHLDFVPCSAVRLLREILDGGDGATATDVDLTSAEHVAADASSVSPAESATTLG